MLRGAAAGLLIAGLPACSTIQSWFPDKERDYQFTAEIPELVIPQDLKNTNLPSLSSPAVSSVKPAEHLPTLSLPTEIEPKNVAIAAEEIKPQPEAVKPVAAESVKSPSQLTHAASNASVLQIDQPKMPATRMVGRALSRQQIEIVERNVDKGYFYVKFDPHAVAAKDESIWDELTFLFGDDPSQEQEYRITVSQVGEQSSEVTVQNSNGKTLSNSVANTLLRLITDGINDVVNQEGPQAAGAEKGS